MKIEREERLKQIRQVGQSIIDNAASILGNEEFRCGLIISAEFNPRELPVITVKRTFIPEGVVKDCEY